jgi:hypothetical protein
LLVSDGTLSSPEAFVTIHAKSGNIAPVARAVINGSAPFYVTSPVYLDGSTSTDANNDPLTYSWTITLPDGSSKPLSGATPADATANFTPLALGTYVVSLIVDDGKGAANSKSSNVATVTLNAIAKPACTNPGQFILDSSGNLTFCR